jgi:hypothetical protein
LGLEGGGGVGVSPPDDGGGVTVGMSLVQVAVVPPFRPRQFHWYLVDESAVSKSVPV